MNHSIQELQKEITAFRDERNWKQFHTPKDLAISITLEAAELLEVFQWSGPNTAVDTDKKMKKVREELADVMMYCWLMADVLDLDIPEIIREKLAENKKKYPVEKSFGSAKKYTELD